MTGRPAMYSCISTKFTSLFGLKGMSDNVCNSTDDTKRYYDLMRELQWDMTLPKFIEKTKCLLKSNFSQVRLIRINHYHYQRNQNSVKTKTAQWDGWAGCLVDDFLFVLAALWLL